jgi:catechol 2,3-dioxygenase-like lactoylglutathione lyase family enzyme
MGLGDSHVSAAIAVSDIERARAFYEGPLGLPVRTDSGDNVGYACGDGSILHIYVSPHAGETDATMSGWAVKDLDAKVDELVAAGVVFEQYDMPGIKTNAKGIADFDGGNRVAYFKDPEGNTHSIAQPGEV